MNKSQRIPWLRIIVGGLTDIHESQAEILRLLDAQLDSD
jgi:hypothetical protein